MHLRVLTVLDDFTRECQALVADTSLLGLRVGRELDAVIARRGNGLFTDYPDIVAAAR